MLNLSSQTKLKNELNNSMAIYLVVLFTFSILKFNIICF